MIGYYCISIFPYYDKTKNKNAFKKRPVIILGNAGQNDYIILPISTVSNNKNLDTEYDIRLNIKQYPDLGNPKICYIRTHKQSIVNRNDITTTVVNIKTKYPHLWEIIINKVQKFQGEVIDRAKK